MTHLIWQIKQLADGQGFPCLFHLLTGFYCPGCGGTRAVQLLLRGEIGKSFQYHPFVPYLAAVLGIECLIICVRWGKARFTGKKQRPFSVGLKQRYQWWTAAGVVIVVINFFVKNICLAFGIDLLPPLLW